MPTEEEQFKRNRHHALLNLKAAINEKSITEVLFWAESYLHWRKSVRNIQGRRGRK